MNVQQGNCMLQAGMLTWQAACARRCAQVYGRHSKSIDTGRQRCGRCQSALAFLGRFAPDGTPAQRRAPTAFSSFVKARFAGVKAGSTPGTPHQEVIFALLDSDGPSCACMLNRHF